MSFYIDRAVQVGKAVGEWRKRGERENKNKIGRSAPFLSPTGSFLPSSLFFPFCHSSWLSGVHLFRTLQFSLDHVVSSHLSYQD
jgi:hypothetical protein